MKNKSGYDLGDKVTWGDGSVEAVVTLIYQHRATGAWMLEATYRSHRGMPATRIMPASAFKAVEHD